MEDTPQLDPKPSPWLYGGGWALGAGGFVILAAAGYINLMPHFGFGGSMDVLMAAIHGAILTPTFAVLGFGLGFVYGRKRESEWALRQMEPMAESAP